MFSQAMVASFENQFLDHVMVVANEIRHFLRKKVPMKELTVRQ